jgi:hypothetical protein
MPKMEIQKKAVTPNAVYTPMIMIQQFPNAQGKLQTQIQIHFASALVTDEDKPTETWQHVGKADKVCVIEDIDNLPDDLKALASGVQPIYAGLKLLVDSVNKVRKCI